MRTSANEYANGFLLNGFDYARQAWVKDGKYITCGHPYAMVCGCYGRAHQGEPVITDVETVDLDQRPFAYHYPSSNLSGKEIVDKLKMRGGIRRRSMLSSLPVFSNSDADFRDRD